MMNVLSRYKRQRTSEEQTRSLLKPRSIRYSVKLDGHLKGRTAFSRKDNAEIMASQQCHDGTGEELWKHKKERQQGFGGESIFRQLPA